MKLTDRTVATLKPAADRVEIPDDKIPGLALRVTPHGAKSWALRYRLEGGRRGRQRRLTLGSYPTLTLQEARKKAQKALRTVDGGADPAVVKQLTRQGDTVVDLAKEYITKHAKVKKRSWHEDQRMLDADVLPTWKARKVKDLTRRDVRELIETIADRGSPITANRCLALVRKMLNFAIEQDWIEANVASLIQKPGTERSRQRVLTDDEIRLVWAACEQERPAMCALMRLRLVTAQRGGELARVRWADIDGDGLTLHVTKNNVALRLPLTPLAVTILNGLPRIAGCDYVFPGRLGNRPLGDMKHAGRRIGRRVLKALLQADSTITTFDFRGHDLRRTASTRMAEAGIPQADIGRVLNHKEGGPRATQVYNRYAYDREKRIAMETWGRVLTGILEARTDAADITMTGTIAPFVKRDA